MRRTKGLQPTRSALYLPTVQNMVPQVTIGGITGDTIFYALGKDATAGVLRVRDYGVDLPIADSGGAPLLNAGSPFLGGLDTSFQINQYGQVYQALSDATGDLGTNDWNIGLLFRTSSVLGSSSNKGLLAKRAGAGSVYWSIHEYNDQTSFIMYMVSGSVTRQLTFPNLTKNTWYCADLFGDLSDADKDTSIGGFMNSIQWATTGGTVDALTTLATTELLTVGAYSSFSLKSYDNKFSRIIIATKANWFPGGTGNAPVWEAYHKENVARLCGLHTALQAGSAVPSFSRAGNAISEKGSKFYVIGAQMPRINQKQEGSQGLLLETFGENICPNSTAANLWPNLNTTTPSSVDSPIDGFLAYTVQESSDESNVAHHRTPVAISYTEDTNGRLAFAHLLIAKEARSWIYANIYEGGVSKHTAYYNLATDTLGATTGNILWIETKATYQHASKEFKHIVIAFTSVGLTGNKRIYIMTADDTPAIQYTGDGSNCYTIAQAQMEITKSPTLWYKFDEPSGASLTDWSGNELTGTAEGTVERVAGVYGSALRSNGTIYIDVPISSFNIYQGTWTCWLKADWTTIGNNRARVFNSYDTRGGNYMFRSYWTNGNFFWYISNTLGIVGCNIDGVRDNEYEHVGFTWEYDGANTTLRGYKNGIYIRSALMTGNIVVPDTNIRIAYWQGATTSYVGDFDDFRLFSHRLIESEIYDVMNNRYNFQKAPSSFLITEASEIARSADSSISYPYSNVLGKGSKALDFRCDYKPGGFCQIWRISNGSSNANAIYGWVDEYGYLNAEVTSGGVSQGSIQLAQDICNRQDWRLGFRWTSSLLQIVALNRKAGTVYSASTALSGFPAGLDTNEAVMPCAAYINNSRDWHHYEASDQRLLFG